MSSADSPTASLTLTFLGTATSVGVPMIGCDCATCRSDDPRDKRLRSSVYLQSPELSWIIDTGPDFRQQCLRAQIKQLDAVLFTHAHTDHVMGFDDVRRFTVGADAVIPVYGAASCLRQVERIYEFAFNGENRYIGYLKPHSHVIDQPFLLGQTLVTPLPVIHGKVETLGYLFSRQERKLVAYIPDVKTVPPETLALLEGVDTLIIDALRYTEHPTHMSFAEATAVATRLRPRQTWFTHFQCQICHAEAEATLPPEIRLAYDGLRLEWP